MRTWRVDPTVAAVPAYFATMGAERQYLKRRAPSARARAPPTTSGTTRSPAWRWASASLLAPIVLPEAARAVHAGQGPVRQGAASASRSARSRSRRSPIASPRRERDADASRCASRAADRGRARPARRESASSRSSTGGVAITTRGRTLIDARARCGTGGSCATSAPGRVALAAAVLGWDFIYYWNHRFMHESRYMWAIHVVHHSSERYNLSTALRQPVADAFGTFVPYGAALPRSASGPSSIVDGARHQPAYQYWIHTDTIRRLGPFEQVLNTPSHHRVHHGSNPQYIDRNHGSILIVWDRLFGTFEPEDDDGRLRPHEEHRDVQPGARRDARARRHAPRRRPVDDVARAAVVRAARARLGVRAAEAARGRRLRRR